MLLLSLGEYLTSLNGNCYTFISVVTPDTVIKIHHSVHWSAVCVSVRIVDSPPLRGLHGMYAHGRCLILIGYKRIVAGWQSAGNSVQLNQLWYVDITYLDLDRVPPDPPGSLDDELSLFGAITANTSSSSVPVMLIPCKSSWVCFVMSSLLCLFFCFQFLPSSLLPHWLVSMLEDAIHVRCLLHLAAAVSCMAASYQMPTFCTLADCRLIFSLGKCVFIDS